MDLDVSDFYHKRPLCYVVVEGKPFTFTIESFKTTIGVELLLAFLKSFVQVWDLEDYWNQRLLPILTRARHTLQLVYFRFVF